MGKASLRQLFLLPLQMIEYLPTGEACSTSRKWTLERFF